MSSVEVTLSVTVEVPMHVLVRELNGEAVILDLEQESYFGLDQVGTRMWQAVQSRRSLRAAYEELLEEFEVSAETLEHDLLELVRQLAEQQLVVVSDA